MALASDAMYRPRIAATTASYVSSSVYYGYVPLCAWENDRVAFDATTTAMETDEDERNLPSTCRLSSSSNSPRVYALDTPSTSRTVFHDEQQQQSQQRRIEDAAQRGSRKRCSGDLAVGNQQKRFREGNAKDDGLAAVRYESAPLRLRAGAGNGGCWPAAGNRNTVNDRHYKRSFPSADYERMLFETHGCTAHQHRRHQLLSENGCVETEF